MCGLESNANDFGLESINDRKSVMFYPVMYLINFLFWKGFRLTEKLQR